MNLNKCLNTWVDHIINLLTKSSKYQGHAINGFKESLKTKAAYQWLKSHMDDKDNNNPFDLNTTTIDDTLYYLFAESDPIEYSSCTFDFLGDSIKLNKFLTKSFSLNQNNTLVNKYNSAKNAFDELEIDENIDGDDDNNQPQSTTTQQSNQSQRRMIINETLQLNSNTLDISQQLNTLQNNLQNIFNAKFEELDNKILNINNTTGYESKSFSDLINLLSFRIRKLLLAEHQIKIQNEYLNPDCKSVPTKISIGEFFIPYSYSTKYLSKMDLILSNTQKQIIEAIKEEVQDKVNSINEDIEKIKTSLEKFKTIEEIRAILDEQKRIESNKLKKRFKVSFNKTKKVNKISFLMFYKDSVNDNLIDDRFNSLNNSFESSNSKSFQSNKFNNRSRSKNKSDNKPRSILRSSTARSRSSTKSNYSNNSHNNRQIKQNINQMNGNRIQRHNSSYNNSYQSTKNEYQQTKNDYQPRNNNNSKNFNQQSYNRTSFQQRNTNSRNNQQSNGFNNSYRNNNNSNPNEGRNVNFYQPSRRQQMP